MELNAAAAGLPQLQAPETPFNFMQQGAANNASTQLKNVQSASGAQDIQNKQRQMQLSMLSGVLNEPDPEKQRTLLQNIVPIANKLNPSYQIDPNIDIPTVRALIMSQVPVAEQPQYGMMNQQAGLLGALRDRLTGAPSGGVAQPGAGTPAEGGVASPAPPAGPMSGQPGSLTDPNTMALMAVVNPAMATAMSTVQKTQYESPQGKENTAAADARGKNTAEAAKAALESGEGYKQVEQTIEALKSLASGPDLPQSKYGVPSKSQAWISQNFPKYDNQKAANSYNTFSTINESQTINAIRDLASTGQIKMTRTLENIINRGYLIDPDASPDAKIQQADAIETELRNSAAAAQNVSAKMSGTGQTQPYQSPIKQTAATQAKSALKQGGTPIVATQAAYDALPSGAVYAEPDGKKYRKP